MPGPDYRRKIEEFNRRNAGEVAQGLPAQKRARVIERMDELAIPPSGQSAYLEWIESDAPGAPEARLLHHAKSPLRQNVCEGAFHEYAAAEMRPLVIRSLPNRGPSALYPLGGRVVGASDCPSGELLAKSFDFAVQGPAGRALIALKYTRDEGGAQDNQFRDLIAIAEQSRGMTGDTAVFLIADGPFYDRGTSANAAVSRIDFLRRSVAAEPQVVAGRGHELGAMAARFAGLFDTGLDR